VAASNGGHFLRGLEPPKVGRPPCNYVCRQPASRFRRSIVIAISDFSSSSARSVVLVCEAEAGNVLQYSQCGVTLSAL